MKARLVQKIVTFVAVALIFTGVAVHASSVESLELESLADEAYDIARVEVLSKSRSQLNGFPHWAVRVSVLESFKGELYDDDTVTIYVPGGSDNDRELLIHGIADLGIGGEFIVFLGSQGEMQWSALTVLTDVSTGERFVKRTKEMRGPSGSSHDHNHGHTALSSSSGSLIRYGEAVERLLSVD